MTRRYCVLYSDGSMNVLSEKGGALEEARGEVARANAGERKPGRLAKLGTIDVDAAAFEELR